MRSIATVLRWHPVGLTTVALVAACNMTNRPATDDVGVVRAQLDSVWTGLTRAMMAGDTAALAAFYTDSAVFAETGSPTARGSAAIRAAAAGVFACCRYLESRLEPEITEVSGNRAFQFGTYRDVIQPTGQPPLTMHGRVSAVLERDTTGAWRISRLVVIRDSSSTIPAEKR